MRGLLIENYKDRVFELCVNQITVIRVSQEKAHEAAVQMIAIYNSIDIPPELNLSSKYHDD